MSMHALLLAVRNTLRAAAPGGLAYLAKDCDLTPPDGQPPPSCGTFYIGVHEISLAPGTQSPYSVFDEIYTIGVTVTVKIRGTPLLRLVKWPELETLQPLSNSDADFLRDTTGIHLDSLVQLLA